MTQNHYRGSIVQKRVGIYWHWLGEFYGKDVQIIGLKVSGNYCDQFWFDKIPILLCEGPKLPNSMISGIWSPGV